MRPRILIKKRCQCGQLIQGRTSYEIRQKRYCSIPCKHKFYRHPNHILIAISKKKLGQKVHTEKWKQSLRDRMTGNKFALGHNLSQDHKQKMIKHGKDHWMWKGDAASYSAVHKWLVNNFGKANRCENINCPQRPSRRFEYALIGAAYTHNKNCFKMLCIPCHRSYDSRLNKLNVQL